MIIVIRHKTTGQTLRITPDECTATVLTRCNPEWTARGHYGANYEVDHYEFPGEIVRPRIPSDAEEFIASMNASADLDPETQARYSI
jgi:hypothetical protein